MYAREFLEQIQKCEHKITNKCEELHIVESIATNITAALSIVVVKSSRRPDSKADLYIQQLELADEIIEAIEEYKRIKRECLDVIEQIQDILLHDILFKHYVLGKPFTEVATDLHYSYNWITENHQKALKEVQKILDAA